VQRFPQAPQWFVSEASIDSHPLEVDPSQLANPAVHMIAHVPEAQRGAALSALAQRIAHAPQWLTSSVIDCSQPFALLPSQLAKPVLHASAQVPDEHDGAALAAGMHRVAHVPQLSALRLVSASHPLLRSRSQSAKPDMHESKQAPAVHVAEALFPAAHERPHAPQLFTLVDVSSSHPSRGSPLQSAYAPLQV
jgi:hypothetical protein